jgi:UDP-N-acetylglucosamine acyltransferase
VLHAGVVLKSHVVVSGTTEIGPGTVVFPFAVLGEIPQDLKYAGENTRLVIGARNRIREHVTMNPGTAHGGGVTRIGDDGLYMAGCHIAHDATVGNRVIVVNSSAVAGHCVIGDDAIVGGLSGVHQWVRIGQGAIIGACTMVTHDVIPHALVHGARGELEGLNLVGLKRRGIPREEIAAVRAAFDALREGEGSFADKVEALAGSQSALVREIVDFVRAPSHRQFLTPV